MNVQHCQRSYSLFAATVFLKLALRYLSVLQEHLAVVTVTGIVANMVRNLYKLEKNLKFQNCIKPGTLTSGAPVH
jgi:hypothetical protein